MGHGALESVLFLNIIFKDHIITKPERISQAITLLQKIAISTGRNARLGLEVASQYLSY